MTYLDVIVSIHIPMPGGVIGQVVNSFPGFPPILINVREYRRGNEEWTI
jgi:hypothetical protein